MIYHKMGLRVLFLVRVSEKSHVTTVEHKSTSGTKVGTGS